MGLAHLGEHRKGWWWGHKPRGRALKRRCLWGHLHALLQPLVLLLGGEGLPPRGGAFEVPSKKRISYGMGRTPTRLVSQVGTFPGRSIFREQEEL